MSPFDCEIHISQKKLVSDLTCTLLSVNSSSPKYKQVRTVLERNKVLLINASNDSTLNPFKKADLEKIESDILKVAISAEDKHFFESAMPTGGLALKSLSSLVLNNSNLDVEV